MIFYITVYESRVKDNLRDMIDNTQKLKDYANLQLEIIGANLIRQNHCQNHRQNHRQNHLQPLR